MPTSNRISLIEEIEQHRKTKLFSYIGSTRIGASYQMKQFDIRIISDHLKKIGKTERIDLLLNSFGGDITFPWRIVNLIREYTDKFHVIVPLHAFSAATEISLGADSITMLPTACLSPTDPQSNSRFNPKDGQNSLSIDTEDIAYYVKFVKEDLGIKSEQGIIEALNILSQSDNRIHPIALGHAKRGSKLADKYATDLLSIHMKSGAEKVAKQKIVKTFGSELYAHDHPINRKEAKKLGLNIVNEIPAIETKIWDLFTDYESELEMQNPFNPIFEFKKIQPTIPLSIGQNLTTVEKTIPQLKLAIIESANITDTYTQEMDVTGIKFLDNNGKINETYSWIKKSANWVRTTR